MKQKTLSFATFNLYNLNEPNLPLYKNTKPWSEPEYKRKIDYTSRTILSLPSDVYGFQELWHAQSLENCFSAAGALDQYDLLVPTNHKGGRIVCAAAVKKGLLSSKPTWVEKFPDSFKLSSKGDDPQAPSISVGIKKFSRPVLYFTIKPRQDQRDIHVFVCHFKSKGPTDVFSENWYVAADHASHKVAIGAAISTVRRTAEACALRMMITSTIKGTDDPVVVLGDVNDGLNSNTMNILTEQPNYLQGLSTGGQDNALYASQTLQEYRSTRDVYYTHIFKNEKESLDQILFSEQFYDNSRKRIWVFDGLDVQNDHLNFDDHRDLGTNDHGVIRARFKYQPAKAKDDPLVG